jgi:hypothetical protein
MEPEDSLSCLIQPHRSILWVIWIQSIFSVSFPQIYFNIILLFMLSSSEWFILFMLPNQKVESLIGFHYTRTMPRRNHSKASLKSGYELLRTFYSKSWFVFRPNSVIRRYYIGQVQNLFRDEVLNWIFTKNILNWLALGLDDPSSTLRSIACSSLYPVLLPPRLLINWYNRESLPSGVRSAGAESYSWLCQECILKIILNEGHRYWSASPAGRLWRHLRWTGQVVSMGHKKFIQNCSGNRPLGRPRKRWQDNIKTGIREIYCEVGR